MVRAEQYATLRQAARARGPDVEALARGHHETGHCIGAVRQLRWSDVTLKPGAGAVRWPEATDKMGRRHETPLSDEAVAALVNLRASRSAIGSAFVFLMAGKRPADPLRCFTRDHADWLWTVMARVADLPIGERYGWHLLRRKFASELKEMPLRDLCALGGWKSAQTVLSCYQFGDEATQREGLARRKRLTAFGLA